MKKLKVFVDIEKEEQYLNDMAAQGYIFKKYSAFGIYTFEKSEPKITNYRIDYRVFNRKKDFYDYISLFYDSGCQHICGSSYSGSQYFLPKSEQDQNGDIFSDKASKSAPYKRLAVQCLISFILMITTIFSSLNSYDYSLANYGYLTPGLWQKNGAKFWFAFLFETPFVILRIAPIILCIVLTFLYGFWGYKAYRLYINKINNI